MISSFNAANAYANARNAIAGDPGAVPENVVRIGNVAEEFARHVQQVDQVAAGAMTGAVETHKLVQTIAETQLAMETVVAVRDKVVEAYQEILRMPV